MIKSYSYKDFRIEILYEDSDIAILNKPSGLLTHKKNELDNSPSLQESLKDQFTIDDNENFKEGIVHRLDKDTSGAIVITKNHTSKNKFREMFKKKDIKKIILPLHMVFSIKKILKSIRKYTEIKYGGLNLVYLITLEKLQLQKYRIFKHFMDQLVF